MRPILYRVLLDHLVDYTRVLGVGTAVSSADSEATAYESLVEEPGAVGNPARVAVTFHRLGLSPRPRSCGAPVREERGVISCEVLSEAQVNHFGVTFPITAGVAEEYFFSCNFSIPHMTPATRAPGQLSASKAGLESESPCHTSHGHSNPRTRTRTRTNTNPNDTEANAAGRSGNAPVLRK